MRGEKKSLSILFILTLLLSLSFYSWTDELPIDKKAHYERICSFYSDRFFSWPAISNPQAAGLGATVIEPGVPNSQRGFPEITPSQTESESGGVGTSGGVQPPPVTGGVQPPPTSGGVQPPPVTGGVQPTSMGGIQPAVETQNPQDIPITDGNYSFSPEQRGIINEVLNMISEFSPRLLAGIREIVAANTGALGLTRILPGGGVIFLSNIAGEMFRYALIHEIGHTVDFYVADNRLREEFYSLFNRNPNDHVTAYSMTSPAEDFAETFAQYLTNRDAVLAKASNSPILMRKIEIIEEILGISRG